jgi:hypothetical protein
VHGGHSASFRQPFGLTCSGVSPAALHVPAMSTPWAVSDASVLGSSAATALRD